jgi:two-component system nitrate/nitrite sensor histidine kinase NarX
MGTWVACVLRPSRARGVLRSPVCRPLALLMLLLLASLGAGIASLAAPAHAPLLVGAQLVLLPLGVGLVLVLLSRVNRQLLVPLANLRDWAWKIRDGRLDARVPVPPRGDFAGLARDINELSDELQRLSERMDNEVCKHTESLAQKTRSLQVLYDVAASINIFNDLDDLLTRFLHTLIDVVRARAATVRLLDEGGMRLVASAGLSADEVERQRRRPPQDSVWGTVLTEGSEAPAGAPEARDELALEDSVRTLYTLSVPLRYHGRTVGVYNLFVDRPHLVEREDIRDLLTSVGRHLGMAIEKVRVDRQAQRLSIFQERNLLAHELHDSLAQTLASLRFQIRILDDTLQQGEAADARKEVERIRNSLDEANSELRGLLAHFRAPMDKRGLLPALEDVVTRFRRETGVVTFFQKECQHPDLPASMEMQVLRILQETLANIRKHSRAHAVRILLRCDHAGNYRLMVEDDGVGMLPETTDGPPGEHLGLEILRERARRLGGELNIDSEPAEGTRVELSFRFPAGA